MGREREGERGKKTRREKGFLVQSYLEIAQTDHFNKRII